MSRVRTTIWTTVFSSTALAATGLSADTTQSEIRRLQQELDQLKANLTQDAPTHTPSNHVQWPGFAVFGKVKFGHQGWTVGRSPRVTPCSL